MILLGEICSDVLVKCGYFDAPWLVSDLILLFMEQYSWAGRNNAWRAGVYKKVILHHVDPTLPSSLEEHYQQMWIQRCSYWLNRREREFEPAFEMDARKDSTVDSEAIKYPPNAE
jgi:hypothetical protein